MFGKEKIFKFRKKNQKIFFKVEENLEGKKVKSEWKFRKS